MLHPQYEMQSLKENGATEAEGTLNKWSESGALRKELSRLREHYRKMQDQSTSARFQKFSLIHFGKRWHSDEWLRRLLGWHYSLLWIMLIYLCQFCWVWGASHLKKEERYKVI